MKKAALYFTAPEQVEVREEDIPFPGAGQVLVKTILSAISPGTEMLVYRGLVPDSMALDESISALSGSFRYPFQYGYSSVGCVEQVGQGVDPGWVGRCVFSFQPHQSRSLASPADLLPLPEGMLPETAVFLPNMETAVNFVMDGRPMIGETVAVFGLGVVGLLTTSLLSAFPLGGLAAWDRYALRRTVGLECGADLCLEPAEGQDALVEFLRSHGSPDGFDLVYEISGAPEALDQALEVAGFGARVVIGSWYGSKRASLDLGGRFHRSRIQLLASQVSTLAPELSARWTKSRRLETAWNALASVRPERWVTHRFPFAQAGEAFRHIAGHLGETLQVVLTYD